MAQRSSRRAFLAGAATAGAAVAGFDPVARAWAVGPRTSRPLAALPRLLGTLTTDPSDLDAVSQDSGRIVQRRAVAVLRPGGVEDVVAMVRYANAHALRIAMRGQGHCNLGQAQVEGGIVIDARPLRRVAALSASGDTVDVEAGATWDEVAVATLAGGRTPAVMPDTPVITVGGTLSIGGIGNTGHRHGAQVDNVVELEVVSGDGRRLVCSEAREPELFAMTLAGLGQCALIVRARLRLVAAPAEVVMADLAHDDLAVFMDDARRVARDEGPFDHVAGRVTPVAGARPRLRLTVGRFLTRAGEDAAKAFDGLRGTAGPPRRLSYADYLHRTLSMVERGKASGQWFWPSPSVTVWVPDSAAPAFLAETLADPVRMEGTEMFDGFAFHASATRPYRRPLLPVPKEAIAFQAWFIRRACAERVDALLASNHALAERVRVSGGALYAGYGAVPLAPADWAAHFGAETWQRLRAAKAAFDPRGVLTPGPGMF